MEFYKHPAAIVESKNIGNGTRVWAFSHILPDAVIGSDCNICDHTFIENNVVIGDRVTVKCGVQLWDGITLEDDVFVGPNVTFTNDPFPRSKQRPASFSKTIVHKGASIGANATILPGLEIGMNAMVGAGAVVVNNVPANAIVIGNPAKITGYVDQAEYNSVNAKKLPVTVNSTTVKGVQTYSMSIIEDMRGKLTCGDFPNGIPFTPKRYFIVYDVPSKDVRGKHAHKELHQFLICIKGSCSVLVDDGNKREEFCLASPEHALYVMPMVWVEHFRYSSDAVLLVLASDIYEPDDYIREYEEFIKVIRQK